SMERATLTSGSEFSLAGRLRMTLRMTDEAIRAALAFVPADERELWLRIGMALKSEFGADGFEMFETWSKSAENFDAKAVKSSWKSFKPGGGVTIATLI